MTDPMVDAILLSLYIAGLTGALLAGAAIDALARFFYSKIKGGSKWQQL